MPKQFWTGDAPVRCQVCRHRLGRDQGKAEFVDGKMVSGPWGIMCASCHSENGVGLGMGKGQKYRQAADGHLWIKVNG